MKKLNNITYHELLQIFYNLFQQPHIMNFHLTQLEVIIHTEANPQIEAIKQATRSGHLLEDPNVQEW